MSFSNRYGYKSIRKELQIDSMDKALRNSLWNITYKKIEIFLDELYEDLICNFFKDTLEVKYPLYDMMDKYAQRTSDLKKRFFNLEWHEAYDFLEFLANSELFKQNQSHIKTHLKNYKQEVNIVLEREFSAYRFVDNIIVKITDENEIEAIEKAISNVGNKFKPISTHLQTSLIKLSDKKKPDYRNSIKESISAVEACCRILTGENTLGKALDNLEKNGIIINAQLKQAFEKLYAYTNSKSSGIRHSIIELGEKPEFEDAKYMLSSCSSFINYLISKSKNSA